MAYDSTEKPRPKGSEVRRIRKQQHHISFIMNAGRTQITVGKQRFMVGGPSDMRDAWGLIKTALFGPEAAKA